MTSQILAIFYLNDLDHYIKESLKIKYYVRYQDDFLLFHQSKDYLKYCQEQIKKFLEKEKLQLNIKTRIFKSTDNYMFLGRNPKGRYIRYRDINRKLKARKYKYEIGQITLSSFVNSATCYAGLLERKISELVKRKL